MSKEIKRYPEIGKNYKHYKGGKYTVLTMAEHSEGDKINELLEKLDSMNLSDEAHKLIDELKLSFEDKLVIYKSIHFGSVHARPLHMWFENIKTIKTTPSTLRFEESNENNK